MGPLRLSALVLLAGCDGVLHLDDIHPPPDAPPGPDAPTQVPCASDPMLNDDFSSGVPCFPWGIMTVGNGGMMSENGGQLTIMPAASISGSFGVCQSNGRTPLMPGGVFVEVPMVVSMQADSYVMLRAVSADNGIGGEMIAQFGKIAFVDPARLNTAGMIDYDMANAQWWRVRPTSNGIVGEVSADAATWKLVGTLTGTPAASVTVDISAGTTGGDSTPGYATFERLDLCP